jgi:3-hydroxybutyryl-CoA dehydrogenase
MVGSMSAPPRLIPIDTIAVLGAGTMGCGLAQVALQAGFQVRLADARPEALEAARDRITARLARSGTSSTAELVTGDLDEACAGAGLVIEAVFENIEVKSEVLAAAERAAAPGTVLATNTSGLPVGALAAGLTDPTRCVGMHFFNPVHRMALCEVIPSEATSEETVAIAREVAERLGKTPVIVADSPGFVASRLNCALGNEALVMLESGIADAAAIDTAARLGLNHPMGPLELLDLVGLDVRLAALRTLERAYGERFRPTRLHEQLVAEGRVGVKVRAGIYSYDENGKRLSG